MAKSSREQIEKDERLVLSELKENGRASFGSISEKYGFSRQKIWRIVNRLEKNKTILGYHAVVDNEKVGLDRFFIMISAKGVFDFKMLDDAVMKIKSLGVTVNGSSVTHGKYDWVLDVTTGNGIKAIKKCEWKIYAMYGQLVRKVNILQVLSEHPVVP